MEHSARTIKKVGLALGGGSAKGLAHIGVIKELERAGIEISYIAGTSMGALVGAWYAMNRNITDLEEAFLKVTDGDVYSASRIARKQDGEIFRDSSIPKFLEEHFQNASFSDCAIPFKAIATDVKDGSQVILDSGNLLDAVRASTALPVVFSPTEIGGRTLMDGGFVNPVPADVVKKMGADFVIAVDVSSKWLDFSQTKIDPLHVYSLVAQAMSLVEFQIAARILPDYADIVLRPEVMSHHWLDFSSARELIGHGETEAHKKLSEISRHTGHVLPKKSPFEEFMDFILYSD